MNTFTTTISGVSLTGATITDLFLWKNGMPLAGKKQVAVRRFVERVEELERFQSDQNVDALLKHFAEGGAIWTIFLAPLLAAVALSPIYDQHVHRAMAFIQTGVLEEIPSYDPRKIDSYVRRYLPFHATFAGIDSRSLDKALWAFGKFLKETNLPKEN